MTQQQAQSVLDISRQIENTDFDLAIQKAYPDRTDLENIALSQMNIPELVYLAKKIFNQFINEFQVRENTIMLPFVYVHPHLGNAQIDNQALAFFQNLTGGNFAGVEHNLLWLAGYQLEYGFFNKPLKKISETISNSLQNLSEKLRIIELNIDNKVKEVQGLFTKLEENNKEITSLIAQKKEELQTITTNLTTSNTQTTQINELFNKGTEQNARLNALVEQQDQNKQAADKKLAELQTTYEKTNEELSQNVKVTSLQIDEFKKQVEINQGHLDFVQGKREFFEERINYLENLIGREVGASLFETFKQRKVELEQPVRFWRWAVPVMAIATIGWIFFLFSRQPSTTDINHWWEAFAVNTLKSIPAIFILLFAINQYRKERNFQEEYAFKSAVALTIDAYSSRISDLSNKDKLIMEAVLSIYKTPIEEKHTGRIKTKTAFDTIKSMADTTKELVKGK